MNSDSSRNRIILGVDPGTKVTGYALVAQTSQGLSLLDLGCIRPPSGDLLSERYFIIHEGIQFLIQKFKPSALAIETPFVHKNMQSALKLGGALSSVVLAAKRHSLSTFGYPPREVKLAVCGRGGASKEEVAMASVRSFNIKVTDTPIDALDAVAIALAHIRYPNANGKPHPKLI